MKSKFIVKEVQMTFKHLKRCSISVFIREKKINYTNIPSYIYTYIYIYTCSTIVCVCVCVYMHYVYTVITWYPWWIGSRTCCGYKNLQMLRSHRWPSVSSNSTSMFQPTSDHKHNKESEVDWISGYKTCGYKQTTIYIYRKNPRVNGPVQFKPMLFNG